MNKISLDALMQVKLADIWPFIVTLIKNPSGNPRAFTILLGGFVLVTLLAILVVVLFVMGAGDEDEEEYYEESLPPISAGEVFSHDVMPEQSHRGFFAVLSRLGQALDKPAKAVPQWVVTVVWIVALCAIWVGGGIVTSRDAICLSCHGQPAFHSLRQSDARQDPHSKVHCVACHENPSTLSQVTIAVPQRAVHFVIASVSTRGAKGYGTPIADKTCASCHAPSLRTPTVGVVTGVRMSHKEPIEAGAMCTDCHTTSPSSGTIARGTEGMGTCLRCHDGKRASSSCATCHVKDIGNAVASRGEAQSRQHDIGWDCGSCHTDQSRCDSCHGIRMPHSNAFLKGGHARPAVEDVWFNGGRVCSRCHTTTRRPCTGCHNGPFPSHGNPSWAKDHQVVDPNNNSCDSCHGHLAWIASRNYCEDCHPGIASKGKK